MFRFTDPNFLYLLILLPLLVIFYVYSNYRRKKRMRQYGDLELLKELMPEVSTYRPAVKFWITWPSATAKLCAISLISTQRHFFCGRPPGLPW